MKEKGDNMHEEMRNLVRPENYKKKHMEKLDMENTISEKKNV